MNRILHLLRRRRFNRELDQEMREHLHEKVEELMARGMSAEQARYAAAREFGNATALMEESRYEWTLPRLEAIWQDLRYAARILRKSPAFTLVAILCLALGIGANAVIFAVIDHVLLRPLPYPDPQRLVAVWARNPSKGQERMHVSAADFYDWREKARGLAAMSAYASWPMNLTNVAEPMRLNGELVSANFFSTVGVAPELGRTFTSDEDAPDKDFVVVLSHRLWRQLGSSSAVVGSTLTLNRSRATVIGVMPSWFNFLDRDTDFWMPLSLSPQNRTNREGRWLSVVARLDRNTTLRAAESEMAVIANRLAAEYPAADKDCGVSLIPLREELTGKSRPTMLAVEGAVVFLLLITCANLANLLLARGSGRSREIAVRAALGAGRGRIVRQLLVESSLLAAMGGALGLALAFASIRAVHALGEGIIPQVSAITLDGRILLFTLLATGFTALLFGLLPAVQATRHDLRQRVSVRSENHRSILVSVELAIACLLLVGATLLAESLGRLYRTSPGFEVRNVLTMRIILPQSKYPTTDKQSVFFSQVLERVASLPGVVAAGEVSDAPLAGNNMATKFTVEGADTANEQGIRFITAGYLRSIGATILTGRDLSTTDTASSPPVALVNQTAARRNWPGLDPIGKRLRVSDSPRWFTVAGVVADIKHQGLAADEGPVVFIPYAQKTWEFLSWTTLVTRTTGDPASYVSAIRSRILSIDKDQPVSEIRTLEQALSRSTATPRVTAWVVSIVSLMALIMAVIGVYGVIAYTVAKRATEIGIRLALGASGPQLFGMLVKQGMLRVGAGIAAGLAGAWGLTRFLESLLFGVRPHDLPTFAGVAAALAVAALIAITLPARRALRIDPAKALRAD